MNIFDGRKAFYQWDTNQKIRLTAPCQELHIGRGGDETTTDVKVLDSGGDYYAKVPDEILQDAAPFNAYGYVTTPDGNYTRVRQRFAVIAREKPAGYIYTPAERLTWERLQAQIGDLGDLETEAKDSLVAAINEAAKSGGGGSGGGKDGTGIKSITYKGEDEAGGNMYTVLLTDGTSYDITAPKGAKGDKGDAGGKGAPGKAATIQVGKVTTGAAGTPASVSNVGTDEAAIFDFTIPQGEKGADAATDLTLGITGATPGQIAKITAVDTQGKPTAWEPADMAGGGGSGGASSEYKDMVTLVDDTLSDENSGLKNYEYDITGFEPATDLLLISFKFPESFTGQIIICDQNNQPLTTEFPYDAKAMLVGIKSMNGRVLHMCTSTANAASRMDMNMSMFFGQLSGASGYERSKMPETVTKIKLLTTTVFAAETVIKIMRM